MRPTVLASAVLALALMGDSLLYAVLPLHAAEFGLSLGWVGVLLAANRIVRLFAFRLIARVARLSGLRRLTIVAAVLGSSSTLAFGLIDGIGGLLTARLAWGVAYGSLALTTLAYATSSPAGSGSRIGASFSIREIGPLLSLAAGAFLIGHLEARTLVTAVGAVSLLAIPVAIGLPKLEHSAPPSGAAVGRWPRSPYDLLSATLGLIVDGIFVMTIGFAFARDVPVTNAAGLVAMILVARRITLVLISPVGGWLADRFGARHVLVTGCALTVSGTLLIALGATLAGCFIFVVGSAISFTVLPLAATAGEENDRIEILARLNVARDAGAALGPICAVALYQLVGTGTLYAGAAGVLAMAAVGPQAKWSAMRQARSA